MARNHIELIPDKAQIAEVIALTSRYPDRAPKLISRSINKVATSARQKITTEVRKRLNIRAGDLKKRNVRLFKANYSKLTAYIFISGARISLTKLGAKQNSIGVSYKLGTQTPSRLIKSAFLATMPQTKSGKSHVGVYQRVGKDRLPLTKENKGPSVPQVFNDLAEFAKATHEREIADKLQKEIETQLDLLMSGRGGY